MRAILKHGSTRGGGKPGSCRAPPVYSTGAGLLDAGDVEIAAAATAGDGALAGVGPAEPRVVGLEVGVDGPYWDFMGADGTFLSADVYETRDRGFVNSITRNQKH